MANYNLSATLSVKDLMTARLKAAQKAAENLTRGVGDLKKQDLRINVEGMDKLKRLREQAAGMNFSPIKLRADLSSLTNRINTVKVNVQTTGGEKLRGLKNSLSELTSGALMATGAGVMGVAGVGYGVANMLETYRATEYQFARNKALFTNGMDEMQAAAINKDLMATVRKYGATTPFTNAEVGKMLEYEAMAGWKPDVAQAALPSLINTALVSGEDPKMVADVLTDGMTAMGYVAGTYVKNAQGELVEASKHFSDVMARTTMKSNTDIMGLGYSQKYVAGLARQAGMTIEEMDAAIGVMADNGVKADSAGTALRGILTRLVNEPKQTNDALTKMGVHLFDENTGQIKSVTSVMGDLARVLNGGSAEEILSAAELMNENPVEYDKGEVTEWLQEALQRGGGKLTDKDRMQLSTKISGTYAMAGFLAWINNFDSYLQKKADLEQNADGTGERFAKEMMDTFHGDIKTLQSAWEDLNFEMFEGGASSGFRNFLQALTADINAFKNSLKDGFDLSDVFGLVSNIITQLKNKFLALDGIGSILAGGILMTGMKKLYDMALKLRGGLGDVMKGNLSTPLSSVGTMNVRAGVVNLSGAMKGGMTGGMAGKGSAFVKDYYSRKESIIGGARADAAMAAAKAERAAAIRANGAFAGIMTGLFGAMDVAAVKSQNQARLNSFDEEIANLRKTYEELKIQPEVSNEQLGNVLSQIQEMETRRVEMIKENNQLEKESLGGAAGATLGSVAGAVVGSFIGPLGTMLGGIIGAAIGDFLGVKAANIETPQTVQKDVFGFNEKPPSLAEFRATQEQTPIETPRASVSDFRRVSEEYSQSIAAQAQATENQIERFAKIDAAYKKWTGTEFFHQPAQDAAFEYYQERARDMAAHPEQFQWQPFSNMPRAEAAELNEEQLLQQMEQPQFEEQIAAAQSFRESYQEIFAGMGEEFTSIFDGLNEQFATFGEGITEGLTSTFESVGEMFSTFGEGITEGLTSTFESVGEMFSTFGEGITEGLTSTFEGVGEMFSTFGEGITEGLTSTFEGVGEMFSTFGEGITEGLTSTFEGVGEMFSTFGEGITEGLTATFEGVGEMFSTFGEQINLGMTAAAASVESSISAIKSSFDAGLQSIQSAWATLPAFFEGIFGGLGGVASAAGAAVAAGLTAPIGGIISAWQGAAAQISSIISSISAQAASVGSVNIGGIGQNYLGTSNWEGGLTTLHEHGGEIIDLPSGTRIYPHAVTVGLLKEEIKNRLDYSEPTFPLPDLPAVNFSLPEFKSDSPATSNTSNSNATFNFGGVNISNGADFEEFLSRLSKLMKQSQMNSISI